MEKECIVTILIPARKTSLNFIPFKLRYKNYNTVAASNNKSRQLIMPHVMPPHFSTLNISIEFIHRTDQPGPAHAERHIQQRRICPTWAACCLHRNYRKRQQRRELELAASRFDHIHPRGPRQLVLGSRCRRFQESANEEEAKRLKRRY